MWRSLHSNHFTVLTLEHAGPTPRVIKSGLLSRMWIYFAGYTMNSHRSHFPPATSLLSHKANNIHFPVKFNKAVLLQSKSAFTVSLDTSFSEMALYTSLSTLQSWINNKTHCAWNLGNHSWVGCRGLNLSKCCTACKTALFSHTTHIGASVALSAKALFYVLCTSEHWKNLKNIVKVVQYLCRTSNAQAKRNFVYLA